jgi:hypothetical protein
MLRSRVGVAIFIALICAAIYGSEHGDEGYGLLAILAAIVGLMATPKLRELQPALRATMWVLWAGLGAFMVFLFLAMHH